MKSASIVALGLFFLVSACATVSKLDSNLSASDEASLVAILEGRDAETKTRDAARRPLETLSFFGIQSDMAVVEVLPGRGWYTEILAPYLAERGAIMGLNYADDTWPMFGFFTAEQIAETIERNNCLLYTSPSPRDATLSRMPSSA